MLNLPPISSSSFYTSDTQVDTWDQPARVITTPKNARTPARRTEQALSQKLLDVLKASIVQVKAVARAWIHNLLKSPGSKVQKPAANELKQTTTTTPALKKHLTQAQSAGFKTALSAVSYLSSSPLAQQHNHVITLRTEQLNVLRDAILDHSVNFSQIKQAVKTRGDLKLVHKLALILAHDNSPPQPSINEMLNSLQTDYPNLSAVLGGLMHFTQNAESGWAASCINGVAFADRTLKPEDRLDAVQQQRFLTERLQTHIDNLDEITKQKILGQLEGPFGMRIRGVIDATAEALSPQADDTHSEEGQLLSRLNRASMLLVNLIDELHNQLNAPMSEAVPDAPMIDPRQLNRQELAALIDAGVYPNQLAVSS